MAYLIGQFVIEAGRAYTASGNRRLPLNACTQPLALALRLRRPASAIRAVAMLALVLAAAPLAGLAILVR